MQIETQLREVNSNVNVLLGDASVFNAKVHELGINSRSEESLERTYCLMIECIDDSGCKLDSFMNLEDLLVPSSPDSLWFGVNGHELIGHQIFQVF